MKKTFYLNSLLGKSKQEAESLCHKHNRICRVARENEINYILTMEFNPNRVNLYISNNKVTRYSIG